MENNSEDVCSQCKKVLLALDRKSAVEVLHDAIIFLEKQRHYDPKSLAARAWFERAHNIRQLYGDDIFAEHSLWELFEINYQSLSFRTIVESIIHRK
jgi:hypothetical protein